MLEAEQPVEQDPMPQKWARGTLREPHEVPTEVLTLAARVVLVSKPVLTAPV